MHCVLVIPPSPGKKNIIRMIDCSHEAKANYLWQPNDFLIITSRLSPEDTVTFIDGTADRMSEDRFIRELRSVRGDLVVVALSSVCWKADHAAFRGVKALFPSVPVFVLGDIFLDERYQEVILMECDGIIVNPYRLDVAAMAQRGAGTDGRELPGVCTRPGQPFFPEGKKAVTVASGVPRHELFLKQGYRFPFARKNRFATVTTVWGCPFSCSYCTDANFPPVVRDHRDVLKELARLAELGISELFIADKVFGCSPANVTPLLREMARQRAFSWTCYFHPQLYDRGLLALMKEAGCHTIITGIDSADVPSLRRYGRRADRDTIERLIAHANELRISVCADFILGLEHETEADIERTIRYALDLPIDFASFNVAAPLPGSDIRRRFIASGQLAFGEEGFDTCGRSGILGSTHVAPGRLRQLRTRAFRKFYLRPSYLLKRLKRTESFEHFLIQLREMLSMIRKI